MKLLAILSAKKLITLSAVGVLSLATVGGVMLSNSNEEPQTVQSAITFDGEAKESPTAKIVEEEKVEEVQTAPVVVKEEVKAPVVEKPAILERNAMRTIAIEKIAIYSVSKTPHNFMPGSILIAVERAYDADNSKFTMENMDYIAQTCVDQTQHLPRSTIGFVCAI